jgi:alpha-tubulin suppressor-like RCC1 family protein
VRRRSVTDAVAVKAGFLASYALQASGAIQCWGLNTFGELGDGTLVERLSPVAVRGLPPRAVALDIDGEGQDAHACAVLDDHSLWCWGSNNHGELGDGTNTSRVTPAPVPGLNNVIGYGAGHALSCALRSGAPRRAGATTPPGNWEAA